jgi:hypothetical protein
VVDGVVAAECGVAVEAPGTERVLEGLPHRSESDAFATEKVAGDVGDVFLHEAIHAAYVFYPHDLQCWLEKPRELG